MENIAPNGKKSNLTPEQYRLVRTAAFKNWFGDWENDPEKASKVIDENGEPLVVYHGTTKFFNVFKISDKFREDWGVRDYGVYFSDDKKTAEMYSLDFTKKEEEYNKYEKELQNLAKNGKFDDYKKLNIEFNKKYPISDLSKRFYKVRLLECFLNIKNPFKIDGKGLNWFNILNGVVDKALNHNYNGIIVKNIIEVNDIISTTYIAFEPNQIKLADGSNTTFDAENPDIRYKVGGSLSKTPSPLKDRIKGSKVNKKGSAASNKTAFNIEFVDSTINTLKNKMNEYNEKHPKNKVSLATLKAVFRRGAGAYSTSHRPNISRSAWAFARVNKFLLKKGGTKVKAAYVQDDDLMEEGGELNNYYKQGGLLAPNGKPSNLTPEQYKLVRTPEFKAWFGDWENYPQKASKVVDENGEPKVVYHATNKDFNEFKIIHKYFNLRTKRNWSIGSHFGTLHQAKQISDEIPSFFIKPFFLNIKDLKRIYDYQTWTYKDWESNLVKLGYIKEGNSTFSKIYKIIEDEKFDGFVYENNYEGGGDSYIVLNPKSIKLADGSNTTFDAENPDIRYDGGGNISWNDYVKTQFNEEDNRYLPENYFEEFIIQEGNKQDYPTLLKEKDGLEYRQWKYGGIGVFDENKKVAFADNGSIQVSPLYQKRGIGIMLVSLLKELNPSHRFGNMTPQGWNLMRSYYDKKVANRYEGGGDLGQEITCIKCGWHWNTNQSDEFDKYICHRCGFDNRTFYDSEPIGYNDGSMLKEPHTIYQIAKKHNVSLQNISNALYNGIETEKEHTKDESVAKVIALHHLWESPIYYDKLKEMEQSMNIDEHYEDIRKIYAIGGVVDPIMSFRTPSGEPTKLTYLQQVLVRTAAFKNWFGDWETAANQFMLNGRQDYIKVFKNVSKVVDKITFEPKVVYHGTRTDAEFFIFDVSKKDGVGRPYGYFAHNEQYSRNFTTSSQRSVPNSQPFMYKCFASVKNPFYAIGHEYYDIQQDAEYWTNEISISIARDKYGANADDNKINQIKKVVQSQIGSFIEDTFAVRDMSFWVLMARDVNKNFKFFLNNYGYDGVFYAEEFGMPYDVDNPAEFTEAVTVFEPKQVKLADGRNINFDPMNEDIRFKDGGKVPNSDEIIINNDYFMSKRENLRNLLTNNKYAEGGEVVANKLSNGNDGKKGGYFEGRSHADGGIKAYNKDTGQMIEVEGQEVIITKGAVNDTSKREFEGEMLTNREILSRINQSGGGVSFEKGGQMAGSSCGCSGKKYKYGGEMLDDYSIVKMMNQPFEIINDNFADARAFADMLVQKLK
jgi:GNAT superfamily N-acetyltransferase